MAASQDHCPEGEASPKPLHNRPDNKMAPIPTGCRIQKRPIPGRAPPITKSAAARSSASSPPADLDGYVPPPRSQHCAVIYISSKSPFMSIVTRARKALDTASQRRSSSSKKSRQTLDARVKALQKNDLGRGEDGQYDVVLVATGRAIQKGVEVGAFFTRDGGFVVEPRTRTVSTVDDIVAPEDVDEEDTARVRYLSCLEVGLRWKE